MNADKKHNWDQSSRFWISHYGFQYLINIYNIVNQDKKTAIINQI